MTRPATHSILLLLTTALVGCFDAHGTDDGGAPRDAQVAWPDGYVPSSCEIAPGILKCNAPGCGRSARAPSPRARTSGASVWPEAPEELAAAIDRSLLRDVSARWGTMRELMDAVREALDR